MTQAVRITRVAAGGDGVGRLEDGRVVFVPRTAPGDEVELDQLILKARYARALPGSLRATGPARVSPACPHYTRDRCGGCQLQHLSYDAQLGVKRAIVGDALRRIGKLDLPDPEMVEAVDEWRYRGKITLAAGRGPAPVLGLHPFDRPGSVFPLVDCHITDLRLMRLWPELKSRLGRLPAPLARVVLRLDDHGGAHVIAESSGAPWAPVDAEALRQELAAAGVECSFWWTADGSDDPPRLVAGPTPSAGYAASAFAQVNPDMGRLVRSWAVDQLGEVRKCQAWDLYGGVGDTAALLAQRGARVVSVDADETAVAWAQRRTDVAAGAVRWVAARVEDILSRLEPPPQAVIVNPPRRGLEGAVTAYLASLSPPPRLVYVSCDPATLARDLARLVSVYRVAAVRVFDLFPQTAHVETVAVLEAA